MKIINLDKRQYLSPESFGHGGTLEEIAGTRDGVMQALAILCSDGDGRGGGDLHSEADIVGSWAGDRIAIVSSTACDASLSAPGLEDIPLVEQVAKSGVDVSEVIIAAILEAERSYSELNGLPADPSQRVKFRKLFGGELGLFAVGEKGEPSIGGIAQLAGFLNAEVEETFSATFVGLAAGVNRLAQAFELPVRWTFTSKSLTGGPKECYSLTFTSNQGEETNLILDFKGGALTASAVLAAFKLSAILDAYGRKAPESMLPAAILKIINDTLAGRNLGGMEE
jgi:hypothetical protein